MSSLFLDPCSTLSSLALKRISTTTQSSLLRCVCVPPPCFETNCKGGKGKAAEGEKKPCLGPRIISISLSLSLRTYTHTQKAKTQPPNPSVRLRSLSKWEQEREREKGNTKGRGKAPALHPKARKRGKERGVPPSLPRHSLPVDYSSLALCVFLTRAMSNNERERSSRPCCSSHYHHHRHRASRLPLSQGSGRGEIEERATVLTYCSPGVSRLRNHRKDAAG